MKTLSACLAVLALCTACPKSSSTPDAAPALDERSRAAAMQGLSDTMDNVLQRLPAARDEARDVTAKLKDVRTRLGEEAVRERMAPHKGTKVPRSELSEAAFNTVVAFNQKRRELDLEKLAASGADGGPLAEMAVKLEEKGALLKRATVLLEEIDKARFELGVLTSDAGAAR